MICGHQFSSEYSGKFTSCNPAIPFSELVQINSIHPTGSVENFPHALLPNKAFDETALGNVYQVLACVNSTL